jgi:two-component system chemotaxis response regulator CheY
MSRPTNALIVDDEAHVRVFLKMLLKEAGIEHVWEAADGTQALALAGQHRPELVLLDVNLPMMNGLEVLGHLAAEHPSMPVIMVTSQSSARTVLDAAKHGAVAYILKHSPKAQALAMLREAIDRLAEAPPEPDAADR